MKAWGFPLLLLLTATAVTLVWADYRSQKRVACLIPITDPTDPTACQNAWHNHEMAMITIGDAAWE